MSNTYDLKIINAEIADGTHQQNAERKHARKDDANRRIFAHFLPLCQPANE